MGWFTVEARQPDGETIEVRQERHKGLREITLFPGNIKEYEDFVGYKVEIVDLGIIDKGICFSELFDDFLQDSPRRIFNRDMGKKVIKEEIEALVNVSYKASGGSWYGNGSVGGNAYGLPVRKLTKLKKENYGEKE